MKAKAKSMRSPLAEVRGLGSARHGTQHWWLQRLTALALIPLSIYVVATFFVEVVYGGHEGAVEWLSSPFAAVLTILFLGVGFHHAANGVQVVIEDYVHGEARKIAGIVTVKFFAVMLALLGSLAVIKVLFFAIIAMMMPHAAFPQ